MLLYSLKERPVISLHDKDSERCNHFGISSGTDHRQLQTLNVDIKCCLFWFVLCSSPVWKRLSVSKTVPPPPPLPCDCVVWLWRATVRNCKTTQRPRGGNSLYYDIPTMRVGQVFFGCKGVSLDGPRGRFWAMSSGSLGKIMK